MNRVSATESGSTCAAIADKLSRLPPFGPAALKILGISLDDDAAARSYEEAFKSDPALTAELLVMANSAAFGGRRSVQTIRVAILYLGLERVRSMAATSALRSHLRTGPRHEYLASVWAHSIASAVAMEALGDARGCPGLYTLGLTHDLGRLGLFLVGGEAYAVELSRQFREVQEANQVERERFGMTHCDAGALVARAWGFPEGLAACMGEHHQVDGGLISTACQMADSLGFPEVPLAEAPPWPDSVEQLPQLEPEALWDEITARITELGQGLGR